MINTLFNSNSITLCSTIDLSLSFPQKTKTIETDSGPYPAVSPDEKNNKTKSIRVELTMDEYNRFSQMAKQENVTLRHLARTKMLDSSVGLREYKDHQVKIVAQIHGLIDKVEDEDLEHQLRLKVRELNASL